MAALHKIKATAKACIRGSFSLLAAAAMVFAAGAFAQSMDTAYVPFRVNVDATATAQLAGGVKFEKLVRAGSTDTLHIISESTTPISMGKVPRPVAMHSSRGKISLELSRQLYKGVDIALYSLNGKQIMHARADASETIKSISHQNIRIGVYVLSVKGISGNIFTTRLTHSGGGMNIDVAFSNEKLSSGSLMEKALPGNWTITVSAEGHLDTSYAFVPETGRGNTPVQNITLRQTSSPTLSSSSAVVVPSSSSSTIVPSSSSSVVVLSSSSAAVVLSSSSAVVPSSSSATPSSSSAALPLTCGTVPTSPAYATLPITPPSLTCGNGRTATEIGWLGSPAINWNNPKDGTYSDIRVMANCGTATDLIASCPGTLTVQPMISCSMAGTGYVESSAIAPPVIACSDGTEPFDIVFSGSLPDWDNPAAGSYEVLAEADCGQGSLPKISCGAFTVNPVTLACGSVSASIYEGLEISPPTLTCSHGTLGTPAWTNEPDWSSPEVGTYTNISVTADCGSVSGLTASCSGTLTVEPVLTCGSVPASGVSGVEIATPVLNCKNEETASDIIWSANAPNWSEPASGTYSNISVTATCGTATKTANCSGTLTVAPITLICGTMPASGISDVAIAPPILTCNNGETPANAVWSESAPDWNEPVHGTYSDISTTADCGTSNGLTATCNGTLAVTATLTCGSVPASGLLISGTSIALPALACNNGKTATDISWSGAPAWSNPAGGTYNNVRATATCGTSSSLTANCSGSMRIYKTVAIGTQTWMAENLNYEASGSKCYENNSGNCAKYGRLYDWNTAMKVCPSGWHLPTDDEWTKLVNTVGEPVGTKLKSRSGWNGTDFYGFSALPGGIGFGSGSFDGASEFGSWWNATEYNANSAWCRNMNSGDDNVRYYLGKSNLFSVRCIKD